MNNINDTKQEERYKLLSTKINFIKKNTKKIFDQYEKVKAIIKLSLTEEIFNLITGQIKGFKNSLIFNEIQNKCLDLMIKKDNKSYI
jgi:hypothetical protein